MTDAKLYQKFKHDGRYYEAVVSECDICNEMFQVKKGFFLKENILSCFKHDINNGACDGGCRD